MEERGVSVIVGFIVLVIILMAAFTFFLPHYLRSEWHASEADHMRSVRGSFLGIKSMVESMAGGGSGSVEIEMSAEPPAFSGVGPAGVLSADNLENMFNSLRFDAVNLYLPSQTYAFEGGGVVLVQDGAESMSSKPNLVTAWTVDAGKIGVIVHYIWIEQSEFSVSSRGTRTVGITCTGYTEKQKNRENVVVDLGGKVRYENAWRRYLEEVEGELNGKGCNAELDGLRLTILGPLTQEGEDIDYLERVTKVMMIFS